MPAAVYKIAEHESRAYTPDEKSILNMPDAALVNRFIFPLQIIQLRPAPGKKAKIIVLHRAEKPVCYKYTCLFMGREAGS